MNRDELKEYFRKAYKGLLKEQDDPFATDDAGDEGGEEEEADEGGDEEAGDEGGEEEGGDDEEGGDEEGGDDEGEGEAKAPEIDPSDKQRFDRSLDDQLQALLIDIEADAIASAKVQQESLSLKSILLVEGEGGVPLDIDKFASEVARLILNFDAFLDIEGMMLAKVKKFLADKHGEEVATEVEKILSTRHDIESREEEKADESAVEEEVPIAVGAGGTGA